MDAPGHRPVLPEETLALLDPRPGETVVDCTVGRGGHTAALARAVGPTGLVIGFDLDDENLETGRRAVEEAGGRFEGVHANFAGLDHHLTAASHRADAVLADLGFSSTQMDDPSRGFSFRADGPLDMRYDRRQPTTAADLLAILSEQELADLIYHKGEDPFARRIARKLVQIRREESIDTTGKLARAVRQAYGARARSSRLDPATRTFMALRIAVNDELGSLQALLASIAREAKRIHEGSQDGRWLNDGARVAIISFHSLEDRIVKRAWAELAREELATVLTRKPVTASEAEVGFNNRSRSAKLRAARIGSPVRRE